MEITIKELYDQIDSFLAKAEKTYFQPEKEIVCSVCFRIKTTRYGIMK